MKFFKMKTAQEYKEIADKVNYNMVEPIFKQIEDAARTGEYSIDIDSLPNALEIILKEKGFKIEEFPVNFSIYYEVSWGNVIEE